MKNRSSYAVLTRFGIIAAVLATLVLIAPVASAADPLEIPYAEDRMDAVAEFSANDEDADPGDVDWSLEGVDAGIFKISDEGVLTFDKSPSFESAKDANEDPDSSVARGKGDNVYKVTVVASGTKQAVEVTVTDVEEEGEVTFDKPQPQITRGLIAEVGDPDGGVTKQKWQWSRCTSDDNPDDCTEITGATSRSRSPVEADEGMYLRATATYTDRRGAGKTASGVTDNIVEERTLSNALPKFPEMEPIPVDENEDGNIGELIVASDADNDVLQYGLDGAGADNSKFKMSESGQLSLVKALDYEQTDEDDRDDAAATGAGDEADGDEVYTVMIKATDPSGAAGMASVMVHLKDVNEPPKFASSLKGKVTLYIAEGEASVGIFTADDLTGEVPAYEATDDDGTTADSAAAYKLEGADAANFIVGATDGQLAPVTTAGEGKKILTADFEDKNSYSVALVASTTRGADDDAVTMYGSLDVTIKVVDQEDIGEVMLSAREPQVGRALVATLEDDDDGETAARWQWYRGGSLPTDLAELLDEDGALLATATIACVVDDPDTADDDERTPAGTLCRIDGETSALYTPGSADIDRTVHAVTNYKDGFGPARENASGSSEKEVEESDPANTAPKFPDQDLNTAGDQSETAMRSMDENAKNKPVGEPFEAGDANSDLLTYSLSGTDAASFKLGDLATGSNSVQLMTAVGLDYETQTMHEVILTATDPSGAQDSITVMVEVIDKNDPPTINTPTSASECSGSDPLECDYAEKGEDPVAEFSANDEDADPGDVDWSLEGVDAGIFKISDEGVLTFDKSPSFESAKDANEDPDSSVARGKGDNVYKVTVVASGTKQAVEVTVTDVEEEGEVTFDKPQPQITRGLIAEVGDPDGGVTKQKWQWLRCTSDDNPDDCTEITGATSRSRSPVEADEGMYLRAAVTYTDRRGAGKTASGVTDNIVEERTLSNTLPKFPEMEPIPVDENEDGNIGELIVASDADNDVLQYGLDGAGADNSKFKMSESGQLSLVKALDYEQTDEDDRDDAAATGAGDEADGDEVYTVMIKATDPSGAAGMASVMVHLKDVNEPPKFASSLKGKVTLYIAEGEASVGIFTADDLTGEVPAYEATDDDGTTADSAAAYKLEGADAANFIVGATDGQLAPVTTAGEGKKILTADFEDKNSYSVALVASTTRGADDDAVTMYGSLDVTIKVVDQEDIGEVMLSAREPQVGRALVATLEDDDDGETAARWQWYRGGSLPTDLAELLDEDGALLATATIACVVDDPDTADDDERTPAGTLCRIDGETSALYTPGSADIDRTVHAVTNYKDGFGPARENASGSSEKEVEESNPANTAPKFPDQDLNTAGDQSGTAMRSMDENAKNKPVGEPFEAGDDDNDLLTYSLSGADAASFKLGDLATGSNSVQLMTAVALDYETQSMHEVILTAMDPSGATDRITVMVEVIDKNDPPTISLVTELEPEPENNAPAFAAETAERSVDENTAAGGAVGDPVTASDADEDTLAYTLGGADAASFAIDNMGQITVGEGTMLDFESETTSYSVTVTATDDEDASDSITVTIMVTDVDETPMFEREAAEFSVEENVPVGTVVGTETAIGVESYSDDSDYFDVDGMGNIKTAMMLDYESGTTSYMVTVTATGTDGSTDTIAVTVTVVDMHPDCPDMDNSLTNDCEALLDAKGDLGGSLNWDTDTAMADWEGVTMSDGRVSGIWLKDEGLDGSVSAALGRLSALTVLNLHTNMLSGEIPDLSGASMLEELYLANNMLDGGIPAWLNGMTNLTNLWLWGNQLTGGIPDLSGLTNLDMLKLANNDLTGNINAMYLPQNVSWLIIDRNGFSGDIPDLSGLTSLKLLWLHTNELTGSVPSGGMLPASLDDLNLRDNMLTGMIPDLSALDSLTRLRLHNNSLSGAVPGSLGGLDSLKQLWLHNETDDDGMLIGNNMFTSIDDGVGGLSDTLIEIQLGGNPWADDACVPIELADVATNDYGPDNIEVCGADDGS